MVFSRWTIAARSGSTSWRRWRAALDLLLNIDGTGLQIDRTAGGLTLKVPESTRNEFCIPNTSTPASTLGTGAFYDANLVRYNQDNVSAPLVMGAVWLFSANGQPLTQGQPYEARSCTGYAIGPDARPLFVTAAANPETWVIINGVSSGSLYDANAALYPANSISSIALGTCWAFYPIGLSLTTGHLYPVRFNGSYTATPFGGGPQQQRPLYFIQTGGFVSGNGTCSGNNVVMPTY